MVTASRTRSSRRSNSKRLVPLATHSRRWNRTRSPFLSYSRSKMTHVTEVLPSTSKKPVAVWNKPATLIRVKRTKSFAPDSLTWIIVHAMFRQRRPSVTFS